MPPRRFKIDEDRLLHLEKWLNELGMDKYDRVHQAIEMLREHCQKALANPGQKNEIGGGAPWEARTYLNAQLEVIEFLDMFDAFRSEPHNLIAPKIKRASSGPFLPVDERAENADARNIQFELSLAAEWRLNGLNVRIGEPDFTLIAGTTEFIVECKRPHSEGSIRSNIRSAKRQLATQLDNSKNSFGAIAICVGRILVPPTNALMNASSLPSVQRDPAKHLRALLTERRHSEETLESTTSVWSRSLGVQMEVLAKRVRWCNFDFHERIVGIFFHAAPPFVHPTGSGRLAVSMIGPVGSPGPAFTYLQTATEAAYNRGWPQKPKVFGSRGSAQRNSKWHAA